MYNWMTSDWYSPPVAVCPVRAQTFTWVNTRLRQCYKMWSTVTGGSRLGFELMFGKFRFDLLWDPTVLLSFSTSAVWYFFFFTRLRWRSDHILFQSINSNKPDHLLFFSWLQIMSTICQQGVGAAVTRRLSWPKQAIWTWLTVLCEQTDSRQKHPTALIEIPTTAVSSSGRSLHPPPCIESSGFHRSWGFAYSMGIVCGCVMVTNPICSLILYP